MGERPRLTDGQRRRLAVLGKQLGRKLLGEWASLVTPDTFLLHKGDSRMIRFLRTPAVRLLLPLLVIVVAGALVLWAFFVWALSSMV